MSKILDKMLALRIARCQENLSRATALAESIAHGNGNLLVGATLCEVINFAAHHASDAQEVLWRLDNERHEGRKAVR